MATATPPVVVGLQQTERPRNTNSSRGGRGSHGRGRNRGGRGGHEIHAGPDSSHNSRVSQFSRPRARGSKGGDGAGRRLQRNPDTRVDGGFGRIFGGQLTRPDESRIRDDGLNVNGISGNDQGSLRADAPAFVPGASLNSTSFNTISRPSQSQPQPQFGSNPSKPPKLPKQKSTAEDIATRTHEDILNGFYECPICTSELGRRSKVWSCKCCWTVFHLSCIKKWSNNQGSVMERPRGEDTTEIHPRQWRCPGCNLPQDTMPTVYNCWCEKEVDPRPLAGLPPHSCGQTCSKSRNGCPHPCDSVCHAGPCAPCQAMGPTLPCFCGQQESTKRCIDTDYKNGWSCMELCGELLPCLRHTCPRRCHEGLCGACEEIIPAKCYCGKVEKEIRCREREEEKESECEVNGEFGSWTGVFSCGTICDRLYDCGLHRCEESCHPQSRQAPRCPNSPDVVQHCQCGKTLLADIPNVKPRVTCEDPVATCVKPCGKVLSCQHTCPKVCHSGPCPPCFLTVDIKCRCGRTSSRSLCHQGYDEPPQCLRVCRAAMSCGRHTCGERCCPGERQSIERQAAKRKLKPFSSRPALTADDIEAEHICTRICDRPLKCHKHNCRELCHKGPCQTCPEAIFEEISCHCGRTVLQPPLPCGTTAPACHFNCQRPKPCGHPQTPHNCHMDDERCPKCPYLVEKKCLCGKTSSKQPCSQPNGQCAFMCSLPSKCGAHKCERFCHRPGDCADSKSSCTKICHKRVKSCSHTCQEHCHAPYPCPETTPCPCTVILTCSCGRIKEEKKCGATRDKPRSPHEILKCDDECARLQRNRELASALKIDIDPVTTSQAGAQAESVLPYSDETLDLYIQSSSSSTLATLQGYETSLHSLATQKSQNSTRFPPCRSHLRAFIHSLAADWGFQSESFDPEPVRHVFVYKNPGWVPPLVVPDQSRIGIRGLSIAECIKLRDRERAKEKEARRAKHNTPRDSAEWTMGEHRDEHGWSRVVSRKNPWNDNDIKKTPSNPPTSTSTASGFSSGRFGSLILKSGVGRGKDMATSTPRPSSPNSLKKPTVEEVADDWEEELEKEEREEEQKEKEIQIEDGKGKEKAEPSTEEIGTKGEEEKNDKTIPATEPKNKPWDWDSDDEEEPYVVERSIWIANN